MTDRFIEVAERPAMVRLDTDRVSISAGDGPPVAIPLGEIGALSLAHPGILVSVAVLGSLASTGTPVILGDEKRLPVAVVLPLRGNALLAERFRRQASASLPLRKRLWQQLVRAKVRTQAGLLQVLTGDDGGLLSLAKQVRSGDPDNVEAQASRRYWPRLFADSNFRRDRSLPGLNAGLNYGYAVLRSLTARTICGSGLHPGLGIHHHNRYDPLCLVDDVMEPFRPIIDRIVVAERSGLESAVREGRGLPRTVREQLASIVGIRLQLAGESRTLPDVLSKVAASLADSFVAGERRLVLPDVCL